MFAPDSSSNLDPSPFTLDRYHAAVARFEDQIAPDDGPPRGGLAAIHHRAGQKQRRLERFLQVLGAPHLAVPVIHVAGTSGKGTTATMIAAILSAAGYKVGLHTSPYVQVPAEKLRFGPLLIAADTFADIAEETMAAANAWCRSHGETSLSYGELWFALSSLAFARAGVDWAVVEVGAGGRFDLTNLVQPAVSVITTIGLDHQATLGPTLAEIAWHKAGIIKTNVPVVTAVTDFDALAVIAAEADHLNARIYHVAEGTTYEVVPTESGAIGTRWRQLDADEPTGPIWETALPGRVQAANAATAVAAVLALAPHGVRVTESAIGAGLGAARLPGRWDWMPRTSGPPVLLDGAHNEQKLLALIDTIKRSGDAPSMAPVVLLGLLEGKDAETIVRLICQIAWAMVVTAPTVRGKVAHDPVTLAGLAQGAGFPGPLIVEPVVGAALDAALALATASGRSIVVTGSLYLVGAVRERWFPGDLIVRARTSWPPPEQAAAPTP